MNLGRVFTVSWPTESDPSPLAATFTVHLAESPVEEIEDIVLNNLNKM